LADQLLGPRDGGLKLADHAAKPTRAAAVGSAHGPVGVTHHPGGIGHGLLGQVGDLGGDLEDHLLGITGARPQQAGDLVDAAAGRPAAVPDPSAGRPTGGLDPPDGGGQLADRPREQAKVAGVGHVGSDHGGVGADLVAAQHLGLTGRLQQRGVQLRDQRLADPAGELGQRGGVRHPPAQRDAAKPLPADRVGDLPAQQLITQPVAVLEEHHAQVGVDGDRWAATQGGEVLAERRDEPGIVQQPVDRGELVGQAEQVGGQDRLP
jgi:hypothetical protein